MTVMIRKHISIGANAISNAFTYNQRLNHVWQTADTEYTNLYYLIAFGAQGNVVLLRCRSDTESTIEIGDVLHPVHSNHQITALYLYDYGQSSLVFAGASSGDLFVWRQNRALSSQSSWDLQQISREIMSTSVSSVFAVSHAEECAFFAAFSDGSVEIWHQNSSDSAIRLWHRFHIKSQPITIAIAAYMLPSLEESFNILLAIGGTDRNIRIYNVQECACELLKTLEGHTGWIRSLTFRTNSPSIMSETFMYLASGAQDSRIRIWKLQTQRLNAKLVGLVFSSETILQGHQDHVTSVQWLLVSDSTGHMVQSLISSSIDNTFIIWQMESSGTYQLVSRVGDRQGNGIRSAFALPCTHVSMRVLALQVSGQVANWLGCSELGSLRFEPSVPVTGHSDKVTDVAWAPDGTFLLSVSLDQTARVWAPSSLTETWHEVSRAQVHGYDINCACFLPQSASSDTRYRYVSGADEKILRVFVAPNALRRVILQLRNSYEQDEVIENDFVSYASVGELSLTNKTSEKLGRDGDPNSSAKIVSSIDSDAIDALRQIVPHANSLQNKMLWPEEQKLYGHANEMLCVASSNDGRILASACKSREERYAGIWLWNTGTWDSIPGSPLLGHSCSVVQLAFSGDDTYLLSVSKDRRVCVYKKQEDVNTSLPKYTLFQREKAHKRIIWSCAWSPDAQLFATGSRDEHVILWKIKETGKWGAAAEPLHLKESVTAIAFCPISEEDETSGTWYVLAVGLENGCIFLFGVIMNEMNVETTVLNSLLRDSGPCNCPSATISRLEWRPQRNAEEQFLAASSFDGSLRVFGVRTEHLQQKMRR